VALDGESLGIYFDRSFLGFVRKMPKKRHAPDEIEAELCSSDALVERGRQAGDSVKLIKVLSWVPRQGASGSAGDSLPGCTGR